MKSFAKNLKGRNPFRRAHDENKGETINALSVEPRASTGARRSESSHDASQPQQQEMHPPVSIQGSMALFVGPPRVTTSASPQSHCASGKVSSLRYTNGEKLDTSVSARRFKVEADLNVISRKARNLNMPSSPPYLPDIVCFIKKQLADMFSLTADAALQQDKWLKATLASISVKCDTLLQLLRTNRADVPDSAERQLLVYITIILSNTYQDMNHVYPKGIREKNYEITKTEAFNWWKTEFKDSHSVPCSKFLTQLSKTYPVEPGEHTRALKYSIDITDNDCVSWFEFDVFTRLFQPWDRILKTWHLVVRCHPGFQSYITIGMYACMCGKGSYVFRLSCTRLGQWAIGYVDAEGAIKQTIPQRTSLYLALIDGAKKGCYLYPMGQNENVDLSQETAHVIQRRIQVSKEQHDIYVGMDSFFELCKICASKPKNVLIEPCGHLICSSCVSEWQKQRKYECPFCRKEMRELQPVIIDPYRRQSLVPKLSLKPKPTEEIVTSHSVDAAKEAEDETPPPRPAKSPIPHRPKRRVHTVNPIDTSTKANSEKDFSYSGLCDGVESIYSPPTSPLPEIPAQPTRETIPGHDLERLSFHTYSTPLARNATDMEKSRGELTVQSHTWQSRSFSSPLSASESLNVFSSSTDNRLGSVYDEQAQSNTPQNAKSDVEDQCILIDENEYPRINRWNTYSGTANTCANNINNSQQTQSRQPELEIGVGFSTTSASRQNSQCGIYTPDIATTSSTNAHETAPVDNPCRPVASPRPVSNLPYLCCRSPKSADSMSAPASVNDVSKPR
eukprot:CFRG4975T1